MQTDRPFATGIPQPPIPGLVLRHLRAPDDYRAMNALANAVRAAEGTAFSTSDAQFQQFYDNLPGSDPATDVVIVEIHGRMVGYGRAAFREEPDGPQIYEVIPFVDPHQAGEEVFSAVLDVLEARLRVMAAGHPPGERLFETFASEDAAERTAVLDGHDYRPVRHFYSMVRPGMADLLDSPLPAGLEIREVRREHLPLIWDAEVEAFRDHWGFTPPTESDYQRFLTDPVELDTALWRVAWDGDQVAGMVRGFINAEENQRLGRKRGYVEHISTRRPWRRRGLARALIAASIPLLRERGMEEGALSVDTENTSGALRIYEACGFRPVSRSATYRKELV